MVRPVRALHSEITVYAACAVSLALGLFFIFVWAPHPWSWEGFDHYHDLALELAAGRPFPTLDVPWGYAYFLAPFYRAFGDHPWIPLTVQAALNASIPLLTYRFASTWLDRPTAIAAAALTGLFSFNTVYASTQSSDAVCTWLFMLAIVIFTTAPPRGGAVRYAATGALLGLAAQFRPNLILLPVALGAFALSTGGAGRWRRAAALAAAAGVMLVPWVVRNYRLTHELLPTSVHGGVQLWYGTLQVGPYRDSRAHNPRAVFEAPAFAYTSLDTLPIVVTAQTGACPGGAPESAALVYWTDRDRRPRATPASRGADGILRFEVPPTPAPSVVYYYFETRWRTGGEPIAATTPPAGAAAPFLYFVSRNHLGDADLHGDVLDVFDLVRLMRHLAWHEPLPIADRLRAAGVDPLSLEAVVKVMMRDYPDQERGAWVAGFAANDAAARLTLRDGSTIAVPRQWRDRLTDTQVAGAIAAALMTSTVPIHSIGLPQPKLPFDDQCRQLIAAAPNSVFYRAEPHLMRRYAALALDNIVRDPRGFAAASAFRALRLFVIAGTEDRSTTQQFAHGAAVYAVATVASIAYFVLFVSGAAIAWRRRHPIALPLLLIVYVPLTIAPMLTNMRYTMTMQPVMFCFAAVALTAPLVSRRLPAADPNVQAGRVRAARRAAGNRTVYRP
jgi:dolichyl-phosphate-mannose-protein mannosyltransferase